MLKSCPQMEREIDQQDASFLFFHVFIDQLKRARLSWGWFTALQADSLLFEPPGKSCDMDELKCEEFMFEEDGAPCSLTVLIPHQQSWLAYCHHVPL